MGGRAKGGQGKRGGRTKGEAGQKGSYGGTAISLTGGQGPRNLKIAGMGVVPHIIGVEANTHLHDLWQRLKPFLQPNRKIRVIWGACSSIGSSDPSVDGE